MKDTTDRNLVDAAWDWAVTETAFSWEGGQLLAVECVAAVFSAALAVLVVAQLERPLATELMVAGLIVVAGLILMAGLVLLFHLALAPYRQRNGLRGMIPSLIATHEDELAEARETHRSEMERAQGEIEDLNQRLEATKAKREMLDTLGAQLLLGEDLFRRRIKNESELNKLVAEIEIWYRWTLGFITVHLGEAEAALFKSTTGAVPQMDDHVFNPQHGNVLASLDRMNGNLRAILVRGLPASEAPEASALPSVEG